MRPSHSERGQALATVAIVLAVFAVIAAAAFGIGALTGANEAPAPTPRATASPTATPTATPSPSGGPVVVPTDPGTESGGTVEVDLDVATPHDVSVVIDDASGTLVQAASGRAGDGMSVRWFDSQVENVDARTIRVTWVGLPRSERLGLQIVERGGTTHLDFVQAAPPAQSDAIGFDRVLELRFDHPVPADSVAVTFTEAAD